jgi:UDPglucose--hexose-1-phosphate uridylyltransferase
MTQARDGDETSDTNAPQHSESRLVWHPLLREYVAQTPGRMHRREDATDCPFCDDLASGRVAPGTKAWIRLNDFPALLPPLGECFILVYSADHDRAFSDLRTEEVVPVIGLWQELYARLAPRYACVMTWETSGAVIGQTQRHPHGQTYAVSEIPPLLAREMESVAQSYAAGAGCPFCSILAEEEAHSARVVVAGEHWLAFVPPYARYPYETHIYARPHIGDVGALPRDGAAVWELAALLPRLIRVYHQIFAGPMPYMLAVHQLADEQFHLHIELLPVGRAPGKLKLAASSETAWGFWLNDALPEIAAARLRALYIKDAET